MIWAKVKAFFKCDNRLVFLSTPQVVRTQPNVFEESYPILIDRVKEIESEILIHKLDDTKVIQLQNELKEVKKELAFCSVMKSLGE